MIITARAIRRRNERGLGTAKGKFEDPQLQDAIQRMTGWSRHQWAKAGRPTDSAKITEVLTRACRNWERYRGAQRLGRGSLPSASIDELRENFITFAESMASPSGAVDDLGHTLSLWQEELLDRMIEKPTPRLRINF